MKNVRLYEEFEGSEKGTSISAGNDLWIFSAKWNLLDQYNDPSEETENFIIVSEKIDELDLDRIEKNILSSDVDISDFNFDDILTSKFFEKNFEDFEIEMNGGDKKKNGTYQINVSFDFNHWKYESSVGSMVVYGPFPTESKIGYYPLEFDLPEFGISKEDVQKEKEDILRRAKIESDNLEKGYEELTRSLKSDFGVDL